MMLVFILENFIISFQSRNDTGSQETADARNKKVIPAFLLPESWKAYGNRTTFTRKKGRWRAIAESVVRQIKRRYIRHIKTRLIRGNCW